MVKRINNYYEFKKEFEEMGRGNQFSDAGFETLFNLITELEDAAGEDYELDVIALCCQFVELNKQELLNDYSLTFEDLEELGALYAKGERLNANNELEEFVILDVESF